MGILVIADRYTFDDAKAQRGGTAQVYRARDAHTDAVVALKLYEGDAESSELAKEHFLRESDALTALQHPNIVRLLDAGFAADLGRHYVVLEWLDDVLPERCKRAPFAGWDSFVEELLHPLLRALVFAHGRGVYHRDIKPSNILLDPLGAPKLADFGIAKLITSVRLGLTVSDFGSPLYAAPERALGQFDERSDLYSLGVTALKSLVPVDFDLHAGAFDAALYQADLPDQAAVFIRRLIAPDPSERFVKSSLALAELESLTRRRPEERPELTLYLKVTAPAATDLSPRTRSVPTLTPEKLILDDLRSAARIESYLGRAVPGRDPADSFTLYGTEIAYHLVVDRNDPTRLVIVHAHERPYSLHEKNRERACDISALFNFGPAYNRTVAEDDLLRTRELIAEHEQERGLLRLNAEERSLFREWRDILEVKKRLERGREEPIDYDGVERRGPREAMLATASPADVDLIGQERHLRLDGQRTVIGTIVDVLGDRIVFSLQQGTTGDLPRRGQLKVNRTPSILALDRQYRALDAVQWGLSARPDLGSLLVRPDRVALPDRHDLSEPRQANLDTPKREALATALGSPDFTVVEGPPGTGKTTFISELVCQYRAEHPSDRILVSGQTHVAVDNAITKIVEMNPALVIVRVGRTESVGEEAVSLTVDAQLRSWGERVTTKSEEYLRNFARSHDIDQPLTDAIGLAEELTARQAELVRLDEDKADLSAEEFELEDRLTDPSPPEPAREGAPESSVDLAMEDALSRVQEQRDALDLRRKKAATALERTRVDLAKCLGLPKDSPAAALHAATDARTAGSSEAIARFRALRALQADWLQRFGKDAGFEKVLLSVADVVAGTCIGIASVRSIQDLQFDLVVVDEASKATPTETLVPMSRGKRWVLVGDPRQLPPFVDDALKDASLLDEAGLTREQVGTTLFDRLLSQLPTPNHVALTVQHRMIPPIGDLVRDCFYGGELRSARTSGEFRSLVQALPSPVTWFSTSSLPEAMRHERKSGYSFVNLEEAIRIREWLNYLNLFATQADERLGIVVLSGYAAQVGQLEKELRGFADRWSHLEVDVASVDAFQGQERDVAIYSVTRSNPRGDLGFLTSVPRLNVALSRGRDGLLIFGDAEHCGRARDDQNPFAGVLEHIRTHASEGCALEALRRG